MTAPFPSQRGQDPAKSAGLLQKRIEELCRQVRSYDVQQLVQRSGASLMLQPGGESMLVIPIWEQPVEIQLPDFSMWDPASQRVPSIMLQALILYYLTTTDGSQPQGTWISFSELADGRFYNQAFQGYTGGELARRFGSDIAQFEVAAKKNGGTPVRLGDRAFAFSLLPRLDLAVVCWSGDEDFPPSYQLLFDAAASHHLPTDACAIAGSMLTRRLLSGL